MNSGKLGFGLMRLPLTDAGDAGSIDYTALNAMVDRYMEAGFHYFDTAAPYHGGKHSEIAFRECVAKRYPREAYTITDKLSFFIVQEKLALEDFFQEQLRCCGVSYFDIYLLHAMNREYLQIAEEIGAFDFVRQKQAEGKIRHLGFSFHDSPQVLEEILQKYPELEYVQLQINYADWENPDVQARACYEIALRYNKRILVMEPVKGGMLANLPEEAWSLLRQAEPEMSMASWAVRFTASLQNVDMVLSGMSNMEQMEDNISYMQHFQPLTEEENQLIFQAAAIIQARESIACTSCRYCVDGCPQKVAIPDFFRLMNEISKFGENQIPGAKYNYFNTYVKEQGMGKASDCIHCGQCESHCPQHLPIMEYLEQTAALLEN